MSILKCEKMINDVESILKTHHSRIFSPRKLIMELISLGYPEPTEVYTFDDDENIVVDIVWEFNRVDITLGECDLTTTYKSRQVVNLDDIFSDHHDISSLSEIEILPFIVEKCKIMFENASVMQ